MPVVGWRIGLNEENVKYNQFVKVPFCYKFNIFCLEMLREHRKLAKLGQHEIKIKRHRNINAGLGS